MSESTEILWENFCRLRLQAPAHRTLDDSAVAKAHADWLVSYLKECETPKVRNDIIPDRRPGVEQSPDECFPRAI
jgi:hypothetical protein